MSHLRHALASRVEELRDPANVPGEATQVNIRCEPETIEVLDWLARTLQTSRAGAAHFLVTNGMYDAMEELDHDLGMEPTTGDWVVFHVHDPEANRYAMQISLVDAERLGTVGEKDEP